MKINVKRIPVDGEILRGSEPPSIMELDEADVRFKNDVAHDLFAQVQGSALLVTGTLRTPATLRCSRCLVVFEQPLTVSHFVFHEVEGVAKAAVLKEAFRVLCKGGNFSFQDMFLDNTLYGDIPTLLNTIHEWGIDEVSFIPSHDLVNIPYLLRHKRVLGNAGLLFGRK